MRLVATIPDSRGRAALELADELGLSRSQLIDEALALFLNAALEVRRGRRLVSIEVGGQGPVCEMATPTLAALEWAQKPMALELSSKAVGRVREVVAAPAGVATARCSQAIDPMSESAHVTVLIEANDATRGTRTVSGTTCRRVSGTIAEDTGTSGECLVSRHSPRVRIAR